MKYISKPITRADAKEFIRKHHRHNKPPVCDLFRVALEYDEQIIAVAIVGRPVARALCDGLTCEVVRLCVLDGYQNACSLLYAKCARIAKEFGYAKIITYTLVTEPGTSLRAVGWTHTAQVKGRQWNCPSRPRQLLLPEFQNLAKMRWERTL